MTWLMVSLLVAVYGGYFLATCWGSRRLLKGG